MVFVLRRHPIVILKNFLIFIVLAAIPLSIFILLRSASPALLTSPVIFPLLAVGGSIYYLSIWLFFFTSLIDYFLDLWIITNDRLLSVEQHGLFARTIAELDLYTIQDATSEVRGVFPTMLNYGNVHVQTAGARARFELEQIGNPNEVRQKILELVDEDRKFHPSGGNQ